jgi:hypothetical protein
MFSSGTKYKLSPECGLARGNPQRPGVLDLFSKFKMSLFNFLADLKVQYVKIPGYSCGVNYKKR